MTIGAKPFSTAPRQCQGKLTAKITGIQSCKLHTGIWNPVFKLAAIGVGVIKGMASVEEAAP
jgi:hypothetical protein